jgi:ABC-2 type transport system ATP-binding protein
MQTAIEIAGLSKRYEGFHLRDIDLKVPAGTVLGLLGQNGAGKSTLLKSVLGLVRKDAGRILLGRTGAELGDEEVRRLIGYVPETPTFYEWMTVARLLSFVAGFYPAWDHAYAGELLARYELDSSKKVKHLSKGMRAKLALLLALAHRPPVLILDEPTSGLDPLMKHHFIEELRRVVASGAAEAVLISSHILGEVEQVADRVAILRDGSLVLDADKREFLEGWKKVTFLQPASGELQLPGDEPVYALGDGRRMVVTRGDASDVSESLRRQGGRDVQVASPDLQEIFLRVA